MILVFMIVEFAGKQVKQPGLRSYLFIAVMTVIQVVVVLYFMYTIALPPSF